MYTEDIKETIDWFIISHLLYADDSQLLAHMKIIAVMEHRRRLETCLESLRDWCSSRRLQLNLDKTELIWFGSRASLVKLRQLDVMTSISARLLLIQLIPFKTSVLFSTANCRCEYT